MTITWTETEDPKGNPTREFVVKRDGRRDLTGAIWLPEEKAHDWLVLFGHGASGTRYQAPITPMAGWFAKAGVASLAIDGPVHGLRKVGDGARGAFGEELRREGHVEDMMADWDEAIAIARGIDGLGGDRLAYFGLSMGSIYGIPFCAQREEVAVATLGAFGTVDFLPGSERYLDWAGQIDLPLLFLMQMEDELFPRDGCIAVFDAFAAEDKRMHCNPGLHPMLPGEEVDFAFNFMMSHIEGTAKRRIVNPLAE